MLKGDLVTVAGVYYDAPIDHHEQVAAIRHHAGYLSECQLGLIVDTDLVGNSIWYQVLIDGQVVWFNSSCVRKTS